MWLASREISTIVRKKKRFYFGKSIWIVKYNDQRKILFAKTIAEGVFRLIEKSVFVSFICLKNHNQSNLY